MAELRPHDGLEVGPIADATADGDVGSAPTPPHPLDSLEGPEPESQGAAPERPRWVVNVAGAGEYDPGEPGVAVVNVNDGSARMSTESWAASVARIRSKEQHLVLADARALPFRDWAATGGVVSRHLPLDGDDKERAVDEGLRVRGRGGRWEMHFCTLRHPDVSAVQFSSSVH